MIARGYAVVTNVNDGAKGDKGDKGDRGLPGAGVKSTVVEYARGLSPTDPPGKYLVDGSGNPLADESGNILVDSRWTSAIPQIPDGFYLWSRTTTIFDDDSESVTYSVGYNGASIATERRQYYLSTSNSRLVGGSWQYTEPDASDGTFIWERFEFMLTDGTIRYSDAVYSKTLHGIINKTDELEQKIIQKVWETDIDAKISSYDGETVQTVRDRVNNTEIDLSGIWTAISDDETTTVTKADGTVVTTLASRVHDIKDTADEHTRTISQDILGDSTTSLKTVANQAANHFTWLVESGTSSSNMTLTNDALRIIARDIDLTGKVTFNSFDTSTKKRITDVENEVESINIGDIVTTYGVSNDPTVQPTTWSSTVPTFQEGKYIWQKTVKTSRTGTDTTTIVCLTGHTGNTGNGVKSTEIKYTASSSGTVIPCMPLVDVNGNPLADGNGLPLSDGVWSSNVPSSKDGDYIWARTKIIYDDDSESITYTVARNGIGIDSTVPYYFLSASKPNHNPLTNSDWSATTPDYQIGKLYWKCEVVTYKDGTKKATDVVEDKGLNEAISRAYLAYNTSVNANTILTAWASDAITSTTTINGGYIKTHTINSEHLATNAIMSQNFLSYNNNTKPFSQTGSYLDLANGNFFSPTFAIINSAPSGSGMTAGAYFNGHINAQSLTLGGDVKIGGDAHTTTTPGIQISTAGLLKAYNAEISGYIKAKTGDIGGWNITTDKLWYGNQTHGAATEAIILTPKGETVNAAIGGASGSNKWAMSIGKAFGVTTNGYMYANSGKIGGWTIGNGTNGHNGIYNGTDTISSTTAGTYVGTDGIRNYNSANSYVSISGGKITAVGADISGKITASSGSFTGNIDVGSLHIDGSSASPKIYYNITSMNEKGTKAGFYLGTDGVAIGNGFWADASGNTSIKSGTTIGNSTIGGTTVVNNINIGSNVTGTGNNQKTQTSLQYGKDSLASTAAGFYLGTDGISIGENNVFQINANGTTGEIGKIGPWKITSTAIYKGSSTMGAANTSTQNNAYFGDNGLSISNKFKVDSGGNATVQGVISANTFNIYTTENNVDSSLTSLIKAEYIADANNAKVRIGQNGTYGTYITMCYANKTWTNGQVLHDDYGKMKLSAKNGIYIVNDTSVEIDGNLSLIGSPESGSEKWTITAPVVAATQINAGVIDATGYGDNGRVIVKGNLSEDRGEVEAGDFYARFNYRIFYQKDSSHLNETVQCIQSISPSDLGTVSGSYNNWLRFGSIASGSYPWIGMPINTNNGNIYVKTGGQLYNLTSVCANAGSGGGTSVSPSDTTPKAVASSSSKGSETAYARGDHQHSISVGTGDNNGQVKIAGQNASVKGLGSAAYANTSDFLSSNTSFLSGATNTSATTSGTNISLGSNTSRQYLIGIGHSSDIEITGLFYVKYDGGWKYYRIHKGSKLNNPTISGNTITLKTTEGTGTGFYCIIK